MNSVSNQRGLLAAAESGVRSSSSVSVNASTTNTVDNGVCNNNIIINSISSSTTSTDGSRCTDTRNSTSNGSHNGGSSSIGTNIDVRDDSGDVRGDGGAGRGGGGRPGDAPKPYDRCLFQSFISAATRLFCDDEQIVLADFLTRQERAYTERDLVDCLGWQDKKIREICSSLERMLFLMKEQLRTGSSSSHSSRNSNDDGDDKTGRSLNDSTSGFSNASGGVSGAPYYYRISPYAVVVCQYRLQQIDNHLEQRRREIEGRDGFICPSCDKRYDALQAQTLQVDYDDAHFLCVCGCKLEQEDSKAAEKEIISLQRRFSDQLVILRNLIRKVWNMQIPVFPIFTKAEKNEFKKIMEQKKIGNESDGSAVSVGSDTQLSGSSLWRQQDGGNGIKLQIREVNTPMQVPRRETPSWLLSGDAAAAAAAVSGGTTVSTPSACGGNVPSSTTSLQQQNIQEQQKQKQLQQQMQLQHQNQQRAAINAAVRKQQQNQQQHQQVTSPGSSVVGSSVSEGPCRSQIRFSMKTNRLGHSRLNTNLNKDNLNKNKNINNNNSNICNSSKKINISKTSTNINTSEVKTNNEIYNINIKKSTTDTNTNVATNVSSITSNDATVAAITAATTGLGVDTPGNGNDNGVNVMASSVVDIRVKQNININNDGNSNSIIDIRTGIDQNLNNVDTTVLSAAKTITTATTAATTDIVDATTDAVAAPGVPMCFISRLGRSLTLEEAAEHQLDMTQEEHERFMELQSLYLDDF